jgi:hypothetical protein
VTGDARTALQSRTQTVFDALDDAKAELADREYQTLLAQVVIRAQHEMIESGLDAWRDSL